MTSATDEITTPDALDALAVGSVVNSRITAARKVHRDGEDGWACIDGLVRTSEAMLRLYGSQTVLHRPDRPSDLAAEVERLREEVAQWLVVQERWQGIATAARAGHDALRDRLGHIVDRYGDAHDAAGCAVLHDLRALLAGREADRG